MDGLAENLQEFLSWYLAPWRRIDRKTFGVALGIASLPGLVMMLVGWGSGAASFLGPLMSLGDMRDLGALQQGLGALQTGAAAPEGFKVDWAGVVNNLCLLALVPLCRMRLRDMGWFGWQELAFAVAMNVALVEGLVLSLTGYDVLPWSMLWAVLSFGGYIWLTLAKGKPRADVHARTDYANPTNRLPDDDA